MNGIYMVDSQRVVDSWVALLGELVKTDEIATFLWHLEGHVNRQRMEGSKLHASKCTF